MRPNLCGMRAPGPTPSQDQDRDETRSWWDGSSHSDLAVSLISNALIVKKICKAESLTAKEF